MPSINELLSDLRSGDVALVTDRSINIIPRNTIKDPQHLQPHASHLLAFCRMYLGEEVPLTEIELAVGDLPRSQEVLRGILDDYNTLCINHGAADMRKVFSDNFLNTVALNAGPEDGVDGHGLVRREKLRTAAAQIISLVE